MASTSTMARQDEVAAGNDGGGPVYRAFYQNVCFEVAVVTAWTNISAYDSGEIKAFDSKDLDKLLLSVVHTFRFVGAVKDGSGWKVYEDSECGGSFEYPEGETVRTIKGYSDASFAPHDISCSRFFTHNGLVYTISAKVNLKGKPARTVARVIRVSRTDECANGGEWEVLHRIQCRVLLVFLRSGDVMYILSVSDANHNVILPHDDQVFTHLVDSFKAK